jgi:hypothetical protein
MPKRTMMSHALLCFVAWNIGTIGDRSELGAAEVTRVLHSLASPLKDLACIYEGRLRWTGPEKVLDRSPELFGRRFQGVFLYRSDGAGLIDFYELDLTPEASVTRTKKVVLKGKLESARGLHDSKQRLDLKRILELRRGDINSLFEQNSPLPFFMTWYWEFGRRLQEPSYEFLGWEDVDGHSCLKIKLASWPDASMKNAEYRLFWIDLDRSGQALRVESYTEGKLWTQIDQIRLRGYPVSPKTDVRFWLPIHARFQSFLWQGQFFDEPVFEETLDIVPGSVQLNAGLPDFVFNIRRESSLPRSGEPDQIGIKLASLDLKTRFEKQRPQEPDRLDPISVQKRLDNYQNEAERQTNQLEAASATSEIQAENRFWQSSLILLGALLLITALICRRKFGR